MTEQPDSKSRPHRSNDGRGGGRASKFTPETRRRLIQLVAKGVPFSHASSAVGISHQSFLNYRKRYPDFDAEIQEAVGAAIEKKLDVIARAAESGDWRAAAWFLEHVHSSSYAKNRVEITGADGAPLAGSIQILLPRKDPHPLLDGAVPDRPALTVDESKELEDAD